MICCHLDILNMFSSCTQTHFCNQYNLVQNGTSTSLLKYDKYLKYDKFLNKFNIYSSQKFFFCLVYG